MYKNNLKKKVATSRIMIASLKMGHSKIRGSGADAAEESEVLTVDNVNLNCMTAKRELQAGGEAYKDFWDGLAA
jgi:hypothetical protein